jgi:hypothetical protein
MDFDLYSIPLSEREAIDFFMDVNILPDRFFCSIGHEMKLYFGKEIYWCCQKGHKEKIRIRVGNFFKKSRLPFLKIVRFLYSWAREYSSGNFCRNECKICSKATSEWSGKLRKICSDYLIKRPKKKIGGFGKFVEIDESLFTRRKNNCGRILAPQWIFGGLCREDGNCFLIEVFVFYLFCFIEFFFVYFLLI